VQNGQNIINVGTRQTHRHLPNSLANTCQNHFVKTWSKITLLKYKGNQNSEVDPFVKITYGGLPMD